MESYVEPDPDHSALLTVDLQKDTLDGQPCEIPGTSDILPNAKRIVGHFRSRSLPIVHVVRIYLPDGSNVDLCRRSAVEKGAKLFLAGSAGAEPADGMLESGNIRLDADRLLSGGFQPAGKNEWIMYKPRWGAFYGTPLERHLRALGVTSIVVVGCNYPNCPRTTIYEASERDFRLTAVSDAISRFDQRAREELTNIGVAVTDADSFLSLRGAPARFGRP